MTYKLENPNSVTFVIEDWQVETWNKLKRMNKYDWAKHVRWSHILMRDSFHSATPPYFTKPVDISMVVYFGKRKRMYDSSNLPLKLYEDGLRGFVIKDDSPKYVRMVSAESRRDNARPRIEITVSLTRPLPPFPNNAITIKLPNVRPPSWNKLKRMNRYAWHKEVTKAKKLVADALDGRNISIIRGRVDIHATAVFRKSPLDSSNIPVKLYEDGLIGWLIKNDSPRYVRRISSMSVIGNKMESGITITISPINKEKK